MGKTVRAGVVVGGLPFGGAVAPGDLVGWSANRLVKANGAAGGNIPAVGVAVNAQGANDTGAMAVGAVEVEGFAALTVGADQYLSVAAAGSLQESVPVANGQYRQRVGTAVAADRVAFKLPVLGEQLNTSQLGVFAATVGTGGVAAGDLVGWGSAGDAGKLVKANGAAGSNVPAVGVALAACAAGATGTFSRRCIVAVAGRTPGAAQYLSVAAAGASQEAAPAAVGQYRQQVGYALSATELAVDLADLGTQISTNALGTFAAPVGTGGVAAGDLAGWGSGGDAGKLIKASGAAGANVPAVAIAIDAYAAGATGTFVRSRLVTVAGRTPGAAQYLAEVGGGVSQEAAPVGAGKYKQVVGWALSATSLFACLPEVGAQL